MRWILAGLLWASAAVLSAAAAPATSTDLIVQARTLDKTVVTYGGEVVGEILDRGAFAWVSIYDGTNALSVWMTKAQARTLSVLGNYKYRGDEIRVRGILHRACPEHGGALDIHAETVRVTHPGQAVPEKIFRSKVQVLVFLLGGLVCLASLSLLRKKRAGK
jgi:hypothetical protein